MSLMEDLLAVVVAGDPCADWVRWPGPADPDGPGWRRHPGTASTALPGGTLELAGMMRRIGGVDVSPQDADDLTVVHRDLVLHSQADLESFPGRIFAVGVGRMPDPFEFAADAIPILAQHEHQRFVPERELAGALLESRDVTAKDSPYLIPRDDLPENVKGYDLDAVRALPDLLASVNFEIFRAG
jgi:hypothetical protein